MSHERKFLDTYFASTTTLTAGSSCWDSDGYVGPTNTPAPLGNLWLSAVQAGTGPSNRIGSQIVAEQLHLRIRIIPNGNAQGTSQFLRFIVFADNECDGAFPINGEVLAIPGGTSPGNSLAFLQLGYGGRFSIFVDEMITLKNSAIWNGTNQVVVGVDGHTFIERNVDLRRHKINWDMTGSSGIQNARQGHIFVIAYWHNQAISAGVITTAVTNPPQFQAVARLRFRDVNSV